LKTPTVRGEVKKTRKSYGVAQRDVKKKKGLQKVKIRNQRRVTLRGHLAQFGFGMLPARGGTMPSGDSGEEFPCSVIRTRKHWTKRRKFREGRQK